MKPVLAMLCFLLTVFSAGAQDAKPDKYQATIDKGLAWLVQQQAKDGSWYKEKSTLPSATTAFAGMALLAEGSTPHQGKYAANLRRAVDWFLKQEPKDKKYHEALADPRHPGSTGRYMSEHGVVMSFLSKVYGEMEDKDERAKLKKRLNDAIAFSVAGQSSFGGWFYTSKIEGHDSAENVSTMLQLQGLLDARDAGLPVPRDTIRKASRYLEMCTDERGGIAYSGNGKMMRPSTGGGRATINAMALAAWLPNLDRYDNTTRLWLGFCAETPNMVVTRIGRSPDLLTHYYLTKVVFHLNEDEWRAAFPDKKLPDHLKWANYRKTLFDFLQREQDKDGAWGTGQAWGLGPVIDTSMALNILLYENSVPIRLSR